MIDHSLPNLFCSYTLAKIATFPITFLPVKEFSLHYFVVLHICKYLATSYSMNQIHFVLVSLNRLWQTRVLDHAKSSSSGGGTYFLLVSQEILALLPHLFNLQYSRSKGSFLSESSKRFEKIFQVTILSKKFEFERNQTFWQKTTFSNANLTVETLTPN